MIWTLHLVNTGRTPTSPSGYAGIAWGCVKDSNPTRACGIMWHHVASSSLLKRQFGATPSILRQNNMASPNNIAARAPFGAISQRPPSAAFYSFLSISGDLYWTVDESQLWCQIGQSHYSANHSSISFHIHPVYLGWRFSPTAKWLNHNWLKYTWHLYQQSMSTLSVSSSFFSGFGASTACARQQIRCQQANSHADYISNNRKSHSVTAKPRRAGASLFSKQFLISRRGKHGHWTESPRALSTCCIDLFLARAFAKRGARQHERGGMQGCWRGIARSANHHIENESMWWIMHSLHMKDENTKNLPRRMDWFFMIFSIDPRRPLHCQALLWHPDSHWIPIRKSASSSGRRSSSPHLNSPGSGRQCSAYESCHCSGWFMKSHHVGKTIP